MNLLDGSPAESETPTPWAVHCIQWDTRAESCNEGEAIYLTKAGYRAQLKQAYKTWRCPRCGGSAQWSDKIYEAACTAAGGLL